MKNKKLKKRIQNLEFEVQQLKNEILQLKMQGMPIFVPPLTQPILNPLSQVITVTDCRCPAQTGAPHQRGPGCLDTWVTCHN